MADEEELLVEQDLGSYTQEGVEVVQQERGEVQQERGEVQQERKRCSSFEEDLLLVSQANEDAFAKQTQQREQEHAKEAGKAREALNKAAALAKKAERPVWEEYNNTVARLNKTYQYVSHTLAH